MSQVPLQWFGWGQFVPDTEAEGQSAQAAKPSFESMLNAYPYCMHFAPELKLRKGFEQTIQIYQRKDARKLLEDSQGALNLVHPYFNETVEWMTDFRIKKHNQLQKSKSDLEEAKLVLVSRQVHSHAAVQLKTKKLRLSVDKDLALDPNFIEANSNFEKEIQECLQAANDSVLKCYTENLEKFVTTLESEDIESTLKQAFGEKYSKRFSGNNFNLFDSYYAFATPERTNAETGLPLNDPCSYVLRNEALEISKIAAQHEIFKLLEKSEVRAKSKKDKLAKETASQSLAGEMDTDGTDQLKMLQTAVTSLTQQLNKLQMDKNRHPKNVKQAGSRSFKRNSRSRSPARIRHSKSPSPGTRNLKQGQSPGATRSQQRSISRNPFPSLRASRLRSVSPKGILKDTPSKYQMQYGSGPQSQGRYRQSSSPKRARSSSRQHSPASSNSSNSSKTGLRRSQGHTRRQDSSHTNSNRGRSPTTQTGGRGRGRGARGRGRESSKN
jgi:hypothetical protein